MRYNKSNSNERREQFINNFRNDNNVVRHFNSFTRCNLFLLPLALMLQGLNRNLPYSSNSCQNLTF